MLPLTPPASVMKREELSIFYSLWLRCFVVTLTLTLTLFCVISGRLIWSSGDLPALCAFAGLLCASPTDQLYDTSGMVRHQLM